MRTPAVGCDDRSARVPDSYCPMCRRKWHGWPLTPQQIQRISGSVWHRIAELDARLKRNSDMAARWFEMAMFEDGTNNEQSREDCIDRWAKLSHITIEEHWDIARALLNCRIDRPLWSIGQGVRLGRKRCVCDAGNLPDCFVGVGGDELFAAPATIAKLVNAGWTCETFQAEFVSESDGSLCDLVEIVISSEVLLPDLLRQVREALCPYCNLATGPVVMPSVVDLTGLDWDGSPFFRLCGRGQIYAIEAAAFLIESGG